MTKSSCDGRLFSGYLLSDAVTSCKKSLEMMAVSPSVRSFVLALDSSKKDNVTGLCQGDQIFSLNRETITEVP